MRSAVLWVVAGSAQGTRSTWAVSVWPCRTAVMSRMWDLRYKLSSDPDCPGCLYPSEGGVKRDTPGCWHTDQGGVGGESINASGKTSD